MKVLEVSRLQRLLRNQDGQSKAAFIDWRDNEIGGKAFRIEQLQWLVELPLYGNCLVSAKDANTVVKATTWIGHWIANLLHKVDWIFPFGDTYPIPGKKRIPSMGAIPAQSGSWVRLNIIIIAHSAWNTQVIGMGKNAILSKSLPPDTPINNLDFSDGSVSTIGIFWVFFFSIVRVLPRHLHSTLRFFHTTFEYFSNGRPLHMPRKNCATQFLESIFLRQMMSFCRTLNRYHAWGEVGTIMLSKPR